ncbi:AMP-activated protein kinase-like protein [Mucilaginibacter gracilis]|uniref:AMP-activated protein kinase-like protein n=1 Tax=Mucilaginibacter gracilis TaxID=423350 RepID=A0A495J8V6_9SPHI|nr:hypothetical protein [Mucilaginibacter gracilis]RKR85213.1 AMP-activated protein kinase-like protein [Mucilaginibacter gracilis]
MFKHRHILLLFMVLLNTVNPVLGQVHKNAFTINNDQMVLYVDLKLSKYAIDSLLRIADITETNAEKLLKGNFLELEKSGWVVKKLQNNQLMLSRPLDELGRNPQMRPVLITRNGLGNVNAARPGYPGFVLYGVNNFNKQTTRELASGITRFYLPGNLAAKKVLLSGNFNDWNTLSGKMLKTDSGWIADIKLQPGKYLYKFIVSGRWISDPNNALLEDDGAGNRNSVYFSYNHTFKLAGFTKASRVTLAGSFNNFNGNELILTPQNNYWIKAFYLAEGMHTYRFLVDGKPITDPANPDVSTDVSGKPVSVLNLGTQVMFKLKGFANAKNVVLAGDFNNWKTNEIHLKKTNYGWALPCVLPAGNYGYKFIVDGNWMRDPANTQQVEGNGQTNSLLVVKPTHTFVLHGYGSAHSIILSGTFNNWDKGSYNLKHEGADWKTSLNLKPGKYLYKFIVDGNWIIDPGNKLWEQNEFGTGNSVLWIE